jgi:hypothetical protein
MSRYCLFAGCSSAYGGGTPGLNHELEDSQYLVGLMYCSKNEPWLMVLVWEESSNGGCHSANHEAEFVLY